MTEDDATDGLAEEGGLTMADLVAKLHVPIPFRNAYVFHGKDGTFLVNRDFTPPAKRLLEEAEAEEEE